MYRLIRDNVRFISAIIFSFIAFFILAGHGHGVDKTLFEQLFTATFMTFLLLFINWALQDTKEDC
ncbi:hypothetical protein BAMA_17025 [Bacillus manliponensis]|uniref:Uncharacterized protein n=1 Tax=Bacillus manliponensis TaxID=574376 RepID=A0A073K0R2_9BACI|nr:hypothetical protein [Bacillus manliponensis]KEK20151.1 hypothetical protein BAMA_17025 [Bacillus manliponensis]